MKAKSKQTAARPCQPRWWVCTVPGPGDEVTTHRGQLLLLLLRGLELRRHRVERPRQGGHLVVAHRRARASRLPAATASAPRLIAAIRSVTAATAK